MTSNWIYSVPVDEDVAHSTGCFTSLPIRIHSRNDIADEATARSIADWGSHVGDGWEQKSGSCWSPVGNWGAFIFPETVPERLGVLTYLANMGNIHDDLCDELDYDEAVTEHATLSHAMNVEPPERHHSEKSSDRKDKLQLSLAKCMLEALDLDRARALRMLDSYREKWLDVMESRDPQKIQTLDDYLVFRNLNGGMRPFWHMVQYGMAIDVSDAEEELIRPVFRAAEAALVLTNDYWSWEREWAAAQQSKCGRIVNAVELFMRTRGLAMADARATVREHIIAFEREYAARREAFYATNRTVPDHLRAYVDVCGLIIAGNHYWCANCPRHHGWRRSVRDQHQQVDGERYGERLVAFKCQEALALPGSPQKHENELDSWTSATSSCLPSAGSGDPTSKTRSASQTSSTATSDLQDSTAASESAETGRDMALAADTCATSDRAAVDADGFKKPDSRALMDPCNYICSMPSKGVRSLLIQSLRVWFPTSEESVAHIQRIVDLLHNSSLILDDIEDGSGLRRSFPATHVVYGEAQAINSATYMFVQAVQLVRRLRNDSSLDLLLEELECLFLGQSWDLYWRHNLQMPTEAQYMEMVDNKTGAMFRLLARLLMSERSQSGWTSAKAVDASSLGRLCQLFGRFFQVRDDFMNLNSADYSNQKGFCEDLDEGKVSFLIVELCSKHQGTLRDQAMGILRRQQAAMSHGPSGSAPPALSREAKKHVVKCLKEAGVMEATLARLRELEAAILDCIGSIEHERETENPMLRVLMHKLSVRDVTVV
ncbi:hypothetical protein GGTG_04211 [Gaeumannomyces tritici R3-111a-1]|uniref:Geranylgeranyl pyrophosphate synthetase n=1 Tax=Gaeumannomyces tritici (strain R3-111a-1) TaxID=644352 RepID=J3NSF9_GAET3|nr:hypothetical protein GGTG_04211 [Gaeumannomyces tritici R3-111a-1]EJT79122.1 hypothetical protein GGTG_04211 [Gaeumannomyces tritici R3-111a-1]